MSQLPGLAHIIDNIKVSFCCLNITLLMVGHAKGLGCCWYNYLRTLFISSSQNKIPTMLRWTITFLIIAIIAAVFGFGGIAESATGIAKILFFIFIVLFLLSLIGGKKII